MKKNVNVLAIIWSKITNEEQIPFSKKKKIPSFSCNRLHRALNLGMINTENWAIMLREHT